MDTKYEEGIRCLKKCWKEHGHIITEDEKAAMKAFRGVFISGKSEPYSHELALNGSQITSLPGVMRSINGIVKSYTNSTMP